MLGLKALTVEHFPPGLTIACYETRECGYIFTIRVQKLYPRSTAVSMGQSWKHPRQEEAVAPDSSVWKQISRQLGCEAR